MIKENNLQFGNTIVGNGVLDNRQIDNIEEKNRQVIDNKIQSEPDGKIVPNVTNSINSSSINGLGKINQEQNKTLALNAFGSGNIMSNGLGNVNMFPSADEYKIVGGASLI